MKNLFKVFLIGTAVFFNAVPFSFSQTSYKIDKLFTRVSPFNLYSGKYETNFSYRNSYKQLLPDENYKISNFEFPDSTIKDTTKPQKRIETFHMKKNPWLAVLYSAIFPGAGQFYNQSYWKVPVLVGLTIYFGYEFYDQNRQFLNYRDQYTKSQTPQNPTGDPNLKTLREFYRTQRDDFTWYFMITYFINLVDAYVDAQLFDFNVKEDKILMFGKTEKTYNFKLHINF